MDFVTKNKKTLTNKKLINIPVNWTRSCILLISDRRKVEWEGIRAVCPQIVMWMSHDSIFWTILLKTSISLSLESAQ